MQVTANRIRKKQVTKYKLWDGEVEATVFRHCGAHGFWSAAIVVEYIDGPTGCLTKNFYKTSISFRNKGYEDLTFGQIDKLRQQEVDTWIAEQLTKLSTGTGLAEGDVGNVEGLLA